MENTAPQTLSEWLLEQIEEFLTINDMDNDGNQFGWYVMHDKDLVTRLRDGKDVSVRIMEASLSFMQNPVTVIPRGNRKGETRLLPLKPLVIKRRSIP
jgi:hypothetical protein